MSLATTAQSIEQHTKDAYTALQSGGVELPSEKNLANLASTINNYFHPPTGEFGLLKRAMKDGDYLQKFPVGAEIDDTDPLSDNQINPWRIVNYGEYKLAENETPTFGAILLRKFAPTTFVAFETRPEDYPVWSTSSIRTLLNGTYLGQCSPALQASVSEITIKTRIRNDVIDTCNDKIWLPSVSEYNGSTSNHLNLGDPFDYFWSLIGQGSDGATSARVINKIDTNQPAYFCAVRDGYDSGTGNVAGILNDGKIAYRGSGSMSPVPACFIATES